MHHRHFLTLAFLGAVFITLLLFTLSQPRLSGQLPSARAASSLHGLHFGPASGSNPASLSLGQSAALKGPDTLLVETQGYFTVYLPQLRK